LLELSILKQIRHVFNPAVSIHGFQKQQVLLFGKCVAEPVKGAFPSDAACIKLYDLALRKNCKKRTMPIQNRKTAPHRFCSVLEERKLQH